MIFGKHVNKFYLKYGFFFLIGVAALVAVDFYQLLIPDITGSIIEGLEYETLTSEVLKAFMMDLIKIALIIVGGRFLWRIFIFGTSRRVDYELRNMMFSHAEKLSQRYYQEKKSGGLMALFTNDLNAVRMAFGPGLMMFFDVFALGGMAFYKMYALDKTITFFALIPLTLIAIMATFISRITGKKFKAKQKAFENMSDFTQENFYGISVIKAFVNEVKEMRAFGKINKDNQDKNVSFVKASTLMSVSIEMFITLIRIMMIGIGGYLVYRTVALDITDPLKFSIGDLTRYVAYFGMLIWPMMAVGRLINMRSQANASLQRISGFLNEPIEIVDDESCVEIDHIEGKITFNNLTFSYPGTREKVLKNINFVIEKGQMVGIIGRTGSGKTTIVDLLLRLFNLKTNEILIDDYDIMKLPIKQLRDSIGYVPQDNFIFSDIIKNNISFSTDFADSELIEQMAKYSDVHENIIDFPNQYDTMVGERGVTLSGGQKQRISIARALLKNPQILIMDDSFSAVDTKTEEEIIQNLTKLRKGKTSIIIAHRISTIKNADKIILIDEGEILAIGSHDELLNSSKLYAEMVLHQQLEAEIAGVE
ncbi:MAG: ABC transporter ATP-binding protein/permease [Firmicutes bacterium]|nr:ABC transporter ATP-binding protein/permease [Bacillota bacterium]